MSNETLGRHVILCEAVAGKNVNVRNQLLLPVFWFNGCVSFNNGKYDVLHFGQSNPKQQLVIKKVEVLLFVFQVLGHKEEKQFCNVDVCKIENNFFF